MLASFTGAQCTGKTTLLKLCKEDYKNSGWNFVDEVTRKVKRDGLAINEEGDNLTQLFILKEHLQNHTVPEDENWLLDRCILDGYVYTKWLHAQGSVERWVLDYAECLMSMLGKYIDVIFYTSPDDIPIEDDGERSINKKFRDDIINIYDNLFKYSFSTRGKDTWRDKVVILSGSIEDRMKKIKENLK